MTKKTNPKRKKVWIIFFILAAAYLVGHYFIFDKDLKFATFKQFITEGKEHIWHIAPVMFVFIILLVKDLTSRSKELSDKSEQ